LEANAGALAGAVVISDIKRLSCGTVGAVLLIAHSFKAKCLLTAGRCIVSQHKLANKDYQCHESEAEHLIIVEKVFCDK
jgi:hypothetical protein